MKCPLDMDASRMSIWDGRLAEEAAVLPDSVLMMEDLIIALDTYHIMHNIQLHVHVCI